MSRRVTESIQSICPSSPDARANSEQGDALLFSYHKQDSVEAFDKPAALPHFEKFVTFVDGYLGKEIQLFHRLRKGKEERVAFENLWMLFDSRDTIYCPLREVGKDETFKDRIGNDHNPVRRHTPQAYRVTTSSGGTMFERSLISTRTKKGINASVAQVVQDRQFAVVHEIFDPIVPIYRNIRNNYCSLIIYCFYIDFDGITYGTVRDVFIFKPYEGDVDIRSLQAYPIQYATNNTLSVRGETFLQLTRVSHKQYEGLTAGPNREEARLIILSSLWLLSPILQVLTRVHPQINSPVIVDVKLAFEGDQDPEQQSIEIPKFNSLFWLPYSGVYDALGKSFCLNPWCYDFRCTLNVYSRPGGNIQNDITSAVKIVLEECETLKQDRSRVKDIFRLMKGEDLVTLLPGAVPGFALRNRRWGK